MSRSKAPCQTSCLCCCCVTTGAGALAAERLLDHSVMWWRSGLFSVQWIHSSERGPRQPTPPNPDTNQTGTCGLSSEEIDVSHISATGPCRDVFRWRTASPQHEQLKTEESYTNSTCGSVTHNYSKLQHSSVQRAWNHGKCGTEVQQIIKPLLILQVCSSFASNTVTVT